MREPLISIIIPVYNGSNYLREAIDSALAQTYGNFEVIVVNDGSSDGGRVEQIARSYGRQIRYFTKKNGGVATALNLGIQNMRGEYFSWLSHDDLYYPNKLAAQWKALQARGDPCAIVYSDFDVLSMEAGTAAAMQLAKQYPVQKLEDSVFPVLYGLIHGCSLLIHKSHFERAGCFDETLRTTQDYDLWFRMLRGQKLLFVPQPLICSRRHSEQGTYTIPCFRQEQAEYYRKAYTSLTEKEIYEVFGHPAFPYWHIDGTIRKFGSPETHKAIEARYCALDASEIAAAQREKFCRRFRELRGQTQKLCIFCCGQYGTALQNLLLDFGISVDYLSDNDPRLWGRRINGILCIPPGELREIREDTLTIAANSAPEPILEQLRSMGFSHITSKQALECAIC